MKRTNTGFQIVHGQTGKVLRTIRGTGKASKSRAMKMRNEIKRRNCGVTGDRCGTKRKSR